MTIRDKVLIASAVFVFGGTSLNAEHRTFADYDRNNDGQISRYEWTATARSFDEHDLDRNGVITREELNRSTNTQTRSRAAGRLDNNESGVVEGYEWPYNSVIFRQLDDNGDSVLSERELADITSATLKQLDSNYDKKIDRNEWPGGFAKFDELDADENGRISAREYFERGGEWQRRQRFGEWDKNDNNVIESTEWRSAESLFHKLDDNGDSVLDWNEFMASTERYESPFGWR